jgi:hypothetical protein
MVPVNARLVDKPEVVQKRVLGSHIEVLDGLSATGSHPKLAFRTYPVLIGVAIA